MELAQASEIVTLVGLPLALLGLAIAARDSWWTTRANRLNLIFQYFDGWTQEWEAIKPMLPTWTKFLGAVPVADAMTNRLDSMEYGLHPIIVRLQDMIDNAALAVKAVEKLKILIEFDKKYFDETLGQSYIMDCILPEVKEMNVGLEVLQIFLRQMKEVLASEGAGVGIYNKISAVEELAQLKIAEDEAKRRGEEISEDQKAIVRRYTLQDQYDKACTLLERVDAQRRVVNSTISSLKKSWHR